MTLIPGVLPYIDSSAQAVKAQSANLRYLIDFAIDALPISSVFTFFGLLSSPADNDLKSVYCATGCFQPLPGPLRHWCSSALSGNTFREIKHQRSAGRHGTRSYCGGKPTVFSIPSTCYPSSHNDVWLSAPLRSPHLITRMMLFLLCWETAKPRSRIVNPARPC